MHEPNFLLKKWALTSFRLIRVYGSGCPTVLPFDSTPGFSPKHLFTSMREIQGFFTPTDSRLENRDVEMSVESPSLVGTIVGNSSDAVINGRPMKKRPLLAGVAGRSKMPRCDSVINQGADILSPPLSPRLSKRNFHFIFLAVTDVTSKDLLFLKSMSRLKKELLVMSLK